MFVRASGMNFGEAPPDDAELGTGESTNEEFARLGQEFVELFLPIIEKRRKNPTDDLASIIANAQVDGQPVAASCDLVVQDEVIRAVARHVNIHAPVVNIAQGAKFNGGIKMEPLQTQSAGTSGLAQKSETVRTGTSN